MIEYVKGRLIEKSATHVVIEANGMAYFINVSLNTAAKIGESESCKLLTHLSIKEDAHILYGFAEEHERRLFRLLISISGVGTGTARMLLSSLSPDEIESAILTNNVALLQSVKGIGGKSAQRIIIELKDKLVKSSGDQPAGFMQQLSLKQDAVSALLTLGFAKNIAEKAIEKTLKNGGESGLTVEKLVKTALQNI